MTNRRATWRRGLLAMPVRRQEARLPQPAHGSHLVTAVARVQRTRERVGLAQHPLERRATRRAHRIAENPELEVQARNQPGDRLSRATAELLREDRAQIGLEDASARQLPPVLCFVQERLAPEELRRLDHRRLERQVLVRMQRVVVDEGRYRSLRGQEMRSVTDDFLQTSRALIQAPLIEPTSPASHLHAWTPPTPLRRMEE